MAAMNISSPLPPMAGFSEFSEIFNSLLYRGARSEHAGIVPLYMHPDERGRIVGVTTVAVAPDAGGLARIENRYNRIVDGMRGMR